MSGKNTTFERLSSFVDGELGVEAGSLVERMLGDDELKSTWGRYQVIGDVLRRESASFDPQLLENIRHQIAEEPTILAPKALQQPKPRLTQRLVAGAAIAASVAAIAVVSVTRFESAPPANLVDSSAELVAPTQQVAATQLPVSDSSARKAEEPQQVATKLNRYLASHSNFASSGSLNGVMPLATYISYDD